MELLRSIRVKPVEGYEGYYSVTSEGKVISHIMYRTKDRLLTGEVTRNGYVRVALGNMHGAGKKRRYLLHRLIARHFIPNPKGLPQVNHKNGVKTDNRIENLEWCTGLENIHHGYKNGLYQKFQGKRPKTHNGKGKLTPLQVINIRHCQGSVSSNDICKFYGVNGKTIRNVWNGLYYP